MHQEKRNLILKVTSKDSLLLASRLGIPFGYALIVPVTILNVVAHIHPGIEAPPYPVDIVIILSLLLAFVFLVLSHRAVARELKNREDEPSNLRKALLRVSVFAIAGTLGWVALFFAALFAVQARTAIPDEDAYGIAAALSMLPILLCGLLLARKEIAAANRAKQHPDTDQR